MKYFYRVMLQHFKIPIAHICGGEETRGSYDNQFRYSITKMSHFHLDKFYKKNRENGRKLKITYLLWVV